MDESLEQSSVEYELLKLDDYKKFKSLPNLIKNFLKKRSVNTVKYFDEIMDFSLTKIKSPFAIHEMDVAVNRLIEAYQKQQKIALYADFDLDGTSGLALAIRAFDELGFKNLVYRQPKRLSEGYGLHNEIIDDLKNQNVDLILTIDVGITAVEQVEFANQLGIDVIITDHHLPKEMLPNAYAILNPNKGFCRSELNYLCGAGVVFFLVLALKSELKKQGILKNDFNAKNLLDCFLIGTVTDMVPLIKENRILSKHGLVALANTQLPGLKHLLIELDLFGRELTSQDVAIRFAPKLNALSRMENGVLPLDIFLAKDDIEAKNLVSDAMLNNEIRVQLQKQAEEESLKYLSESPPVDCIVINSENFHKGVIGLIATKLSQEFSLPAFVGAIDSETGLIHGSSRSAPGNDLSVLKALDESEAYLLKFGGHDPAAGYQLAIENVELFTNSIQKFCSSNKIIDKVISQKFDVTCELIELDPNVVNWLNHLGPYGIEWEIPEICFINLSLQKLKKLKGGHLKLNVSNIEKDVFIDVLMFFPAKDQVDMISNIEKNNLSFSIIGQVQWNYFAGRKTIQIIGKSIQII